MNHQIVVVTNAGSTWTDETLETNVDHVNRRIASGPTNGYIVVLTLDECSHVVKRYIPWASINYVEIREVP